MAMGAIPSRTTRLAARPVVANEKPELTRGFARPAQTKAAASRGHNFSRIAVNSPPVHRNRTAPRFRAAVIQPKIGFELEMLALVDVNGRPAPEKTFLGRYGAQNLELQVDQNRDVEGTAPTAAADANFQVATNNPAPMVAPNFATLGPYDLPAGQGLQTRVGAAPGGPPVVDPRAALNFNLLSPATWRARTNLDRYTRPPLANNTGLNNAQLPAIDAAVGQYKVESDNWESARALNQLNAVIAAATTWLAANNHNPAADWYDIIGTRRNSRYTEARNTIQALQAEAVLHRTFWNNPLNQNPPVGLERLYKSPATAWSTKHPIAGAGGPMYASILEIVTRPYEPETLVGRNNLIAAMTEADQLAQDIEAGTGNFANRIPLHTINGTTVFNHQTHIGNGGVTRNPQTTDASIQSTFAIDLSQIPSLVLSTVAFGARQSQFSLKHQADIGAGVKNAGTNRAELEMALAVRDATAIINEVKAQVGGGAPSFVNLRGLVTLICQYLRMGKYWSDGVAQSLDKNLTDLLSRTDLSLIYRDAVPPAEKVWLNAAPGNKDYLIGRILHHTGRAPASALLNTVAENLPAGNRPACRQFVDNVFRQTADGITGRLGGFQKRPVEDIDPTGARGADTRPATAAHRVGPVFEMRNMIPKLGGQERFPRNTWVPLATYMAELIELLNARTEAQATQDAKVHENPLPPLVAGPGHTSALAPPQAPW